MRSLLAFAILLGLFAASRAGGQCQNARLFGVNPIAGERLGSSVDADGGWAISGAPLSDFVAENAGAAVTFKLGPGGWSAETRLTASDATSQDRFGHAVAIHGAVAVVGAPRHDAQGSNDGAAYVFRHIDGEWVEEAKLLAPLEEGNRNRNFGAAIEVDDDIILIGAPDAGSGTTPGNVYVFDRVNGAWVFSAVLDHPARDPDLLGNDVLLYGTTAFVGASSDDTLGINAGAVYIFERRADTWTIVQSLFGTPGLVSERFGSDIAITADGGRLVVGATRGGAGGTLTGAVYIHELVDGVWTLDDVLEAPDGEELDFLGASVAVKLDTVFVGAPSYDGGGRLYTSSRQDGAWTTLAPVPDADLGPGDVLGGALALSGTALLAGLSGDDEQGSNAGAVAWFDIASGPGRDCNDNGTCDSVDVENGAADTNGDLIPDECQADTDGDGVVDDADNCPDTPNENQADCDGDGVGDACSADADGDSVPDTCDNCPDHANPHQSDCDDDGVGDVCTIALGIADDCNANGTPDPCEVVYRLDDGSVELFLLGPVGDWIWLNAYTVVPGQEAVDAITTSLSEHTPGLPITFLLYDDPNNDGNPVDATLIAELTETVPDVEPDTVSTFALDRPVTVGAAGERFFVGAMYSNRISFPTIAGDIDAYQAQSWIAVAPLGAGDINTLANNEQIPLQLIGEACCDLNFVLRAAAADVEVCACPDLDGDGVVGFQDLLAILTAWGPCGGCAADVDGNGVVEFGDLLAVLSRWGVC